MYFLIEDYEFLKKYNSTWVKFSAGIIASVSTVKVSENQNKISGWWSYRFSWKKSWTLIISLDVDVNKDENYYPQEFLKEY